MVLLSYIAENPLHGVVAVLLAVPAYHLLAWLLDEHSIRSIPGPPLAALSDAWLGYWAAQGKRSEQVHEMHQKYGA
jgi:benzoate 4-monooxygenase